MPRSSLLWLIVNDGILSIYRMIVVLSCFVLPSEKLFVLDGGDEFVSYFERAVGNLVPAVEVHFGVVVGKRNVTDDAEADKRHTEQMACLCDGAALHVDGKCIGEVAEYGAHFVLVIHKPVAADDKS